MMNRPSMVMKDVLVLEGNSIGICMSHFGVDGSPKLAKLFINLFSDDHISESLVVNESIFCTGSL